MSYLTAQIFSDNRINTLSDRLIYFINEIIDPGINVDDIFVLSGSSAKVLQETDGGNATNVIFVCSNQKIYDYLAKEIKTILNAKTVVKFKERLLIELDFVLIEIYYFDSMISTVEYRIGQVFLQDNLQIPTLIK